MWTQLHTYKILIAPRGNVSRKSADTCFQFVFLVHQRKRIWSKFLSRVAQCSTILTRN